MKKGFSFLLAAILTAFLSHAQNNTSLQSGIEIKSKREMYSKVFLNPSGTYQAVLSTAPVHFKKNGKWEEIDTEIRSVQGALLNESNVMQTYFPINISNTSKIRLLLNESSEVFIHSVKVPVWLNEQNILIPSENVLNNSTANVDHNKIGYVNIYPNVSDEYAVLKGQLKNNIILNALPECINNVNSGYFGFQETLELPAGWKITGMNKNDVSLTSGALLILDSKGDQVLTIPEPVFFDQYGLQSDGSNPVQGLYSLKLENDQWKLATLVPVSWLKHTNTIYPVSIDPTIVIAGTTGGWQSPNNFVDNPVVVFLGVCCSNLTHRAWNKFNTTAIPSTSCIIDVEYQANVTGEANATPELVFINDVTGAFGPYGAITPAAYNDFGTGFYTSFTIGAIGVYGYYSLGASANALLQAQLPLGWFQVAMQFNNEPSTNYKIISGTTSNLRVTYAAPPCVLPVELVNFEAVCKTEKVLVNWEVASQVENHHFSIERTIDGINFETIGTITDAGNSHQSSKYSFVDESPVHGLSYYSLKQYDHQGQMKELALTAVQCSEIEKINASPNPGTGSFSLEGVLANSEVTVTNLLGETVFRASRGAENPNELFHIDLSEQTNGIYFIHVLSKNGLSSEKIILNK